MPHDGYSPPESPHLVLPGEDFDLHESHTKPPRGAPDKAACKRRLENCVEQLDRLQRVLYADNRHAVLLIFQAMDAAGKDGTIRAVLSGVNPAGCQVTAFRPPSENELDHDFLWRHVRALPERGRIGVFNRSWYEEVLAVRVMPDHLQRQRLPSVPKNHDELWRQRYESICAFERHLARNGTLILKFWLNVSRAEQRRRLLERLDEPEKNWKFDVADLAARADWGEYMAAYRDAIRATSHPWAPWYVIPADSKPYMRAAVAEIVHKALQQLDLQYPSPAPELLSGMQQFKDSLKGRRGR